MHLASIRRLACLAALSIFLCWRAPAQAGWAILYNSHDVKSGEIPASLLQHLSVVARQGKEIRLVAFTSHGGWATLAGKNEIAGRNVPDKAFAKLDQLVRSGAELKWIAFTPSNGWVILYDKGGIEAAGIPDDASAKLTELAKSGAELKSIAFTPSGGWAILYDKNGYVTHNIPQPAFDRLAAAAKENAGLKTIAFTPDGGWVLLLDNGAYFHGGELPSAEVAAQLKELTGDGKTKLKSIAFNRNLIHLSRNDEATRRQILDRMARLKVPGMSIAVIDKNRVVVARGYGLLEAGVDAPVDEQTRFQAGSVSKPVAALGCLRLVQRGKLTLDDDLNRYLTSWKIKENQFTPRKPVTLREVLSHTAGFNVHGFGGYPVGRKVPTLVQVLDGVAPANSPAVVVETVPGTRFSYSGGGISVMQQAVIDVTGQPFAEVMETEVLAPLDMKNSTFAQPLPVAWHKMAAVGHENGKPIAGKWHTFPEQAAAGLWTTPSDLSRYVIALARAGRDEPGALLPPDLARQMLARQTGGWGLGIQTTGSGPTLRFSHNGRNVGFLSLMIGCVHTGQGIVVMINTDTNESGAIMHELAQDAATEYGWPD